MMLIEPERSSFRRWGRRSPRNARSDSPVYEASTQTWEFPYFLGAKKTFYRASLKRVLTLEFRWRIRSRTEAHKFKEAVSDEEHNNLVLSSLYADPDPALAECGPETRMGLVLFNHFQK